MEERKSLQRAICPYEGCGKEYYNQYNLKRHVDLKHLNLDMFVCLLCDKRLSSKQNLNEHMNTHTGRNPYLCPYDDCGERFKHASQLSIHKKLHRNMLERQGLPEPGHASEPFILPIPIRPEFNQEIVILPPITGPQYGVKLTNIFY